MSADLHGNLEDFERLRGLFLAALAKDPDTHWAVLGDSVHGPDAAARAERPDLYDFPDRSADVVAGLVELEARCPDRLHYLLGNHDHAHLGGPRTARFHADEAAALEAGLAPEAVEALRSFFGQALLGLLAPCGALLAHGSPDDALEALEDLDAVSFVPEENEAYCAHLLDTFLRSYGQPGEVTARLLRTVSRSGAEARFVLHGHDRDEAGWFTEGGNQGCPVLFGASREAKRVVWLELGARYPSLEALEEGRELRRLYP